MILQVGFPKEDLEDHLSGSKEDLDHPPFFGLRVRYGEDLEVYPKTW